MYRKYWLFEMKLLLRQRKNWFLGLFLLLFFPIFFLVESREEPVSLESQKHYEANMLVAIFQQFPETERENPEGAAIYNNLTEQASLVNYQLYYLSEGRHEDYVENGLMLNELRLELHEMGNKWIPEHLVYPREETLKEEALLSYIQANDLPLEPESTGATHYLVAGLGAMSGVVFYMFVLLAGSEILVFDQRHRTVVSDFPISFFKKISAKISGMFLYIAGCLLLGLGLGFWVASSESGSGNFSYPVLLYWDGGFEAVSTMEYLLYALGLMMLVMLLGLIVSVLLNQLFRNAYANVLIGLGLFLLPDLLMGAGVGASFLQLIKYVDFAGVLDGDLAIQLGADGLDVQHVALWLALMILLFALVIFMINKLTYTSGRKVRDA
ncbi:hypothetical protein [Lentibacillus sediminis]|uniref:hypothetical protein n=1 Tax=Lentibacillus sediminis TaxID=1940529 RepID=UPI000C1BB482|nr:hypothetical protein [Lentibacillus sediminis]